MLQHFLFEYLFVSSLLCGYCWYWAADFVSFIL